jgi:hypothetical protein
MKLSVQAIPRETVREWLLHKHYAKRIPQITHSFGCFEDKVLQGVVTYGIPPSPSLCIGICGEEWKDNVYELNRLAILEEHDSNLASYLVANSMKLMPKPSIIVSYADTSMGHVGYVYQATNFIYTGLSAKRREWREIGKNTHSKSVVEMYSLEKRQSNPDRFEHVDRPQKHRYIYFRGSKKEVKQLKNSLNYEILPYPKGESKRYVNNKAVSQQQSLF